MTAPQSVYKNPKAGKLIRMSQNGNSVRWASLIVIQLLLVSCGSTPTKSSNSEGAPLRTAAASFSSGDSLPRIRNPNAIAPGYQLGLASLEDRSLNGKFRVQFDGTVKLPYKVTLPVAGL